MIHRTSPLVINVIPDTLQPGILSIFRPPKAPAERPLSAKSGRSASLLTITDGYGRGRLDLHRIAIGLTIEPVAPLSRSGSVKNKNS